ncbi:MAG: hypothetical protein RDV41_14025, partial [Planctomycetota bacterium]|nr:hypothetical protein [Planctomycetota bacterium]
MFELNRSIFDVFTIGHAALPCYIGWRLGQSGRWRTVVKPVLIVFALIAICEPVEMLLTAAGLQTFDEAPSNVLGDIVVSVPFSLFGIYAGRRERERAQARMSARRAAQKERLSMPQDGTKDMPGGQISIDRS